MDMKPTAITFELLLQWYLHRLARSDASAMGQSEPQCNSRDPMLLPHGPPLEQSTKEGACADTRVLDIVANDMVRQRARSSTREGRYAAAGNITVRSAHILEQKFTKWMRRVYNKSAIAVTLRNM
jgi:hypothetical protein